MYGDALSSNTPHGAGRDRRIIFSRVHLALLASLALSFVLITQVTVAFHSVRVKLVRSSTVPADGTVRVDTSAAGAAKVPTAPVAVIARIRNDSPRAARFDIRMDGRAVCGRDVPGRGTTRRVDCVVTGPWDAGAKHAIEVAGGRHAAWELAYLEIATHHGATRHYDLIIVPAAAGRQVPPPLPLVVAAFLLMAAVFLLPPATMPGWARRLHGGLCVIVAAVTLLIVLSPRVSAYSVLLSVKAFGAITLVLAAPRLWFAGEWLWENQTTTRGRVLGCAAAGIVVMATYGAVVGQVLRDEYGGNYSGFVKLSRAMFDSHPVLSGRDDVRRSLLLRDDGGYDGQFMYYMTFDPFLQAYRDDPSMYGRFIDATPYRFGRIGFSLLTRLFSASQWPQYPRTMMWLILVSLLACGVALASLAWHANASVAWGLLIVIVPGFWLSLLNALPEPVAAALLLGAYLFLLRGYAVVAGGLFAVSLLIRETGAILAVGCAVALFVSGRRRDGVRVLLISLVPLMLWRLYVGWTLLPDWGAQAFFLNVQNLGLPFVGIAELWSTIRQGTYFPEAPLVARAGILYPILLGFGLVIALAAAVKRPGAATLAAVLYGVIAVSFTYDSIWVHVSNAQRGTYELFIVLALVFLDTRGGSRPLRWSLVTFWVAAALYVFFGALEADLIRKALLSAVSL